MKKFRLHLHHKRLRNDADGPVAKPPIATRSLVSSDGGESLETGTECIDTAPPTYVDRVLPPDNTRFYPQRLESNQIRLLEILPADYSEPISCCLTCVAAASLPVKYVALSYCWGDQVDYRSIRVNGSEGYVITTHLYQGLRRLRHKQASQYVWIDALCINQTAEEEKSQQVQQMASIYSLAQKTVIWLGEMDESEPNCRRDRNGVCTKADLSAFEHQQATSAIRRKLQEQEERSCQEAHHMSVWWKRLWVVQEFAASKDTPVVLIGPHAIDWDLFASLRWTDAEETPLFVRLRQEGRQSLYNLLTETADDFGCGRPEDRIFALLSLVDDDQLPLMADYGKPLELVCAEAAKYIAQEHESVDVLLDSSTRIWPRLSGLASWIPEWSRLQPRGYAKSQEGYAACSYTPHLEVHRRQGEARRSSKGYTATEANVSCSCESIAELKLRCLQFDRVTNIVDMKTLPRPGKAWKQDEMVKVGRADFRPQTTRYGKRLPEGVITDKIWYLSRQAWKLAEETKKERRRGTWAPTYILSVLDIDNRKAKRLDLDRSPYMGYLMLEYIFEGSRGLFDLFETRPASADDHKTMVLTAAEMYGFKATENVIRDLEIAFDWQEAFLWKVHNGSRVYGDRNVAPYQHDDENDIDHIRLWALGIPNLLERSTTYKSTTYNVPMTTKGISRVLFSTADGFTGLGPAGLKPGDEIVVPFGASRPWVLRNHGDHHVLIGDAIVPGIMSGRLETLYEEGLISAADYTLL